MDAPIRVLVIDDHPALRDGIHRLFSTRQDLVVAGAARGEIEALGLFRALAPDVVLVDYQTPGMNGNAFVLALRREFPEARVLMLTDDRGDTPILQAFAAGVTGYVLKDQLDRDLICMIRSMHAGSRHVLARAEDRARPGGQDARLTRREVEILTLVALGNSNKAIANQFDLSEMTVKAHMRNILAKLAAGDRTHAVTIAIKRGIIAI